MQLNDAEKLTYEYYKAWQLNHFETEDDFEGPREVTTTSNLNGRINCKVAGLIPGTVYYYRTFFKWNGKYFYSPEVKTLKTNGTDVITVGTNPVDEITDDSARLSATVPFEAIGLEVVDAGFMISKKYSNASEFNLKNAVPWGERYQNPDADIYFVETRCIDKNFEMFISGLEPETRYYVCGYLDLTDYLNLEEGETVEINGSIQQFVTEKIAQFRIEGEGDYPWIELADGLYASGNQGVSGSESKMVVTVIPNVGNYLCFDLKVSSESGYDQLYIRTGSRQLTYSGERQEKVRWRLNSNKETVVEFIYSKDGGTNVGEDRATVSNFTIE